MSGYLPTIEYRTTFEEDAVVVRMTPLSRQSYVQLVPKMQSLEQSDPAIQASLLDTAAEILNLHIVEITGIRDGNGEAVKKEVILNQVYFAPLLTELFQHLVISASLGKEKSGGSENKLPDSIAAQGLPPASSAESR